ncbi:MAG: S8 family serine peptidase [Maribacter sp.]|nr:S8 family serine peptidase [Maribacter sp.]
MPRLLFLFCITFLFVNCKRTPIVQEVDSNLREESAWFHLDIEQDSFPGISLDRSYRELISEKEGIEVIVAVMDNQIDIHHEDLKDRIYTNTNEIPNNNIDDDKNGYIDDIHGWNFLGYGKYNYESYLSYVHIRIIRAFSKKFKGKTEADIAPNELNNFEIYQEALQRYRNKAEEERYIKTTLEVKKELYEFIKTFADRIPGHEDYTMAQLDSLEIRNEEEKKLVERMKKNISNGYTFEHTYKDEENLLIELYTLNNLKYNERSNIGDNPYDYETVGYGNPNVDAPSHISHGTQVAGLIAATRNNGFGIRGISNNIKIMPLVISPEYGDYNDKDLANAIRYAVDNGAKIINMSGGKYYTENKELLFSALKYAENKGILFVTSSGNDGRDIDKPVNTMHLIDKLSEKDTVENLIRVSAITKHLDSNLFDSRNNYGKESVDLFAPGVEIMTTDTSVLGYINTSGSSLSAAITSGVAALLMSHYPNLSYKEIKKILMESGTPYDLIVNTREKDSVPFNDLSKSGRVINTYNALRMAEDISNKKE